MTPWEIACWVWEHEFGKPYRWGGDDPIQGFDCSGLVVEGLKSAGILPCDGDWTAAGLAARFPEVERPMQGDLLFWNRGATIGHVEIVWVYLQGKLFTLGASGGGSTTTTSDAASAQNAYVKIRPAIPGWVKMVRPFV